jgi:hypothetical protein
MSKAVRISYNLSRHFPAAVQYQSVEHFHATCLRICTLNLSWLVRQVWRNLAFAGAFQRISITCSGIGPWNELTMPMPLNHDLRAHRLYQPLKIPHIV